MTITLQTANPAVCTSVDKALCCSRNAITSNIGSFCDKLGCSLAQCGRGREPLQVPLRHLRREGVGQIQMSRRAGKAEKSKSSKLAFSAAKSRQLPVIKVTSQTTARDLKKTIKTLRQVSLNRNRVTVFQIPKQANKIPSE